MIKVEYTLHWCHDQNHIKFLLHALFNTPNQFLTRKPTVFRLNYDVERVEFNMVHVGKLTFLLLFM